VIIYTHTHGTEGGLDESHPPGGMVLDPGPQKIKGGAIFKWERYAEFILAIPAKNVVIMTMSCFSGSLIEHLRSPKVRDRWKDRRQREGRNFIVLTSQNKKLKSPPILKDREIINPFTYAVIKAIAGEADGFRLVNRKPDRSGCKDGKLTLGELTDFILYTTKCVVSDSPLHGNTADPQLAGSFDPEDVLLVSAKDARRSDDREASFKKGVERFKRIFTLLDKNKDGVLTRKELGIPNLFERLDLNGDGKLTVDEAVKVMAAARKKGGFSED
jgi:hypothetical protein